MGSRGGDGGVVSGSGGAAANALSLEEAQARFGAKNRQEIPLSADAEVTAESTKSRKEEEEEEEEKKKKKGDIGVVAAVEISTTSAPTVVVEGAADEKGKDKETPPSATVSNVPTSEATATVVKVVKGEEGVSGGGGEGKTAGER